MIQKHIEVVYRLKPYLSSILIKMITEQRQRFSMSVNLVTFDIISKIITMGG